MEHQSAVAYGNHFLNGYLGRDLSGTGLGLQWDFIIVHESAHEWWGNNISAQDHADMWVHESFANYAEGRDILRGLNKTFYHQTVTGRQVQDYISRESGIDLSKVFAQYLSTTRIPVFEY